MSRAPSVTNHLVRKWLLSNSGLGGGMKQKTEAAQNLSNNQQMILRASLPDWTHFGTRRHARDTVSFKDCKGFSKD